MRSNNVSEYIYVNGEWELLGDVTLEDLFELSNYVENLTGRIDNKLSNYALKSEIPSTSKFALKTEIPDTSNYALKSEIPDVSNLALKTEIPDLSGYALNTDIPDVSIYAPKASPVFSGSISLGRAVNSEIGVNSIAIGSNVTASGWNSHAIGAGTTASGAVSHAEGSNNTAEGDYSHAEGYTTDASGESSHAEGLSTRASGEYSHAEGQSTSASGDNSHSEGYLTKASGEASHVEGYNTISSGFASHVGGCYNVQDAKSLNTSTLIPQWTSKEYAKGDMVLYNNFVYLATDALSDSTGNPDDSWRSWAFAPYRESMYAEIIGNGGYRVKGENYPITLRSNARALDWTGNEYLRGSLYINCDSDSTNGKKVATEAYVDTRIPAPPTTDGTYTLQVTVSNGTPTYSWI